MVRSQSFSSSNLRPKKSGKFLFKFERNISSHMENLYQEHFLAKLLKIKIKKNIPKDRLYSELLTVLSAAMYL